MWPKGSDNLNPNLSVLTSRLCIFFWASSSVTGVQSQRVPGRILKINRWDAEISAQSGSQEPVWWELWPQQRLVKLSMSKVGRGAGEAGTFSAQEKHSFRMSETHSGETAILWEKREGTVWTQWTNGAGAGVVGTSFPLPGSMPPLSMPRGSTS